MLEEKSEVLLFIPAAILGYLFYLIGDVVFLWVAAGWTVMVSLLYGIRKSIHYPITRRSEFTTPVWYNTNQFLRWGVLIIYGLYIGPLAFFAALNNILPENQEIPPLTIIPPITGISQGAIATNDLILIILLFVHLIAYTLIAGPTILLYLILIVQQLLKLIQWFLLRIIV